MKKTAYIVSVKYAPGSYKEFVLMGKKLRSSGMEVKYLLSKCYAWIHKEPLSKSYFVTKSSGPLTILIDSIKFFVWQWAWLLLLFKKTPPDFLCFYNPHPLNFAIAGLARLCSPYGIRVVYLHEPAKPDKKNYGFRGQMFFQIVEFCQKLALAYSTDVILASPVGIKLFEKYFPNYRGAKHYAPLLLPDCPSKSDRRRQYFSMVGRFNFSKQLDTLIDAANYAAEKGEKFRFQVVTASNIDKYVKRLTAAAKETFRIVNHDKISDEEISQALAQSYAVLCLQPMVTQSGVVPVAFMNETPVIARSTPGFAQFVQHGLNGWLVGECFEMSELIEAMKSVKNNFGSLSVGARQSYLELFAEKNWEKHYGWLLNA